MTDLAPPCHGYRFDLSCPRCGSALSHVTAAVRTSHATRAIAACDNCRQEYVVNVELLIGQAMGPRPKSVKSVTPVPRREICGGTKETPNP